MLVVEEVSVVAFNVEDSVGGIVGVVEEVVVLVIMVVAVGDVILKEVMASVVGVLCSEEVVWKGGVCIGGVVVLTGITTTEVEIGVVVTVAVGGVVDGVDGVGIVVVTVVVLETVEEVVIRVVVLITCSSTCEKNENMRRNKEKRRKNYFHDHDKKYQSSSMNDRL